MSSKSAEGRKKGTLYFYLNIFENEPQIDQRPIKGGFIFLESKI
jgi:hypothetical protein